MAATVLVGMVVSIGAFALVRAWESERTAEEFQWRAESRARIADNTLRGYEESLYSLRDTFHATKHLSAEEFEVAARAQLNRHRGMERIEWLPLVRRADRAAFEADTRKRVDPGWLLRDHEGATEPAGDREQYLPVLYYEPSSEGTSVVGADQFLGSFQRAIQQARTTGTISATRRVPLSPQTNGAPYGVALILPVYRLPDPITEEERDSRLMGFLRGTFRLRDLALQSVLSTEPPALDVWLSDHTPAATEPFLFGLIGGRYVSELPPGLDTKSPGLKTDLQMICAGRRWVMHARPGAEWLASRHTYYPTAFLAAGLCLTTLLASRQAQRHRRAEEVERLVTRRTEQLRQAQERLREDIRQRLAAEERYRAFVSQSTEAIWHCEIDPPMSLDLGEEEQINYVLEHAILAECNDVCARMYGRSSAAEIVGTRLSGMMPRHDPTNVEHLRRYVRSRFRVVDSESHEVDADGKEHVFVKNIIGIVEDGHLVRAWGTQRDITEQRRFQEARDASEKRLRLAMEAGSIGIWEWDSRNRRVICSNEVAEMYGLPPHDEAKGYEAYVAAIHPDDRERVRQTLSAALRDGSEFDFEYRIERASTGRIAWLASRGHVQRDAQGNISGLLGVVLDITARREAEEERIRIEQKLQDTQKLESLGVLAGGIAHDFNNLLTGILGNASLARMDLSPTSPVQQSLAQIEQAAQRAAELCKQMLAYSGQGRFVIQTLDLTGLVEDAKPLLEVSISKSAVIKYRLSRNLPAVNADATQLRQILMNLVINASDACGGTNGVIEVSTGLMQVDRTYLAATHLAPNIPEGPYVFLEVSDNGCGMDADTQKRIFDPFFTTKFTGRGLGLAAVLGIVRGHKGALKVYSEPGHGTTFKLLLPSAVGAPEQLPARTNADDQWRGRGKVLVVDDEETVRAVTSRMLTAIGFEPACAAGGREAISYYREHQNDIEVVLLDLTMPEMDGANTFSELRQLDPELKVMLMSGFNEQEAINRFAGKGLAAFLQKPFKPDALRETLRKMLAEGKPRRTDGSQIAG